MWRLAELALALRARHRPRGRLFWVRSRKQLFGAPERTAESDRLLAYCLQITLQRRLHALAPGLTARSALEKFAAVQMIDVHLPTTDGRELLLTRYTQPEPELQLLIQQLKLSLPPQPPPRIATGRLPSHPL